MARCLILALALVAVVLPTVRAEEGSVIATMHELRFSPPKEKGTAELVPGKAGQAVRFRWEKESPSVFFTSNIRGTPEWDRAAGFSFWVQGDGSDSLGGLQFIYDNDYAVRYDFAFPIKGTGWTKVKVAWEDLVPVLPGANSRPLGGPDGNLPSRLSGLWFGKWWYWRDYPAHSFTVDEIRLEPKIVRDTRDYRPTGRPLARVLRKLKAGQPLTVVTMGDSLTDFRHWANRQVSWPNLLKEQVATKYRSEVTLENSAMGGTQLRQNLVLIPRWLARKPRPDLVTIYFGGNDWEAGMRGEQFYQTCVDAIDRVRRATGGSADVLLITTNPSATNWKTMAELAEACRRAARDRRAGLADTEAAFHTAGREKPDHLFVDDRVHLSPAGHTLVAETVLRALETGGQAAGK
ncbi:MAG TPA: SGNH/GDSL hydrolase family protein [Armatimonadota bacterium]|nr:SGNH/GDSL hydrolase family protein [Armatimonadota bacterium]